jgi:hypothetical protein
MPAAPEAVMTTTMSEIAQMAAVLDIYTVLADLSINDITGANVGSQLNDTFAGTLEVYPGSVFNDPDLNYIGTPYVMSYPSSPYISFDMPDIGGLSGNFRYNYFSRFEEVYENWRHDPDVYFQDHPNPQRKYDLYGPPREVVLYLENSIGLLGVDDVLGDFVRENMVVAPAGWFYLDEAGMSTEPLFSIENMKNMMSELDLQNGQYAQLNLFDPDKHSIAVKQIAPEASNANAADFWMSQINIASQGAASSETNSLLEAMTTDSETSGDWYEISSGQLLTTSTDDFPDLGRTIDFNYLTARTMFLSTLSNPNNPYPRRYVENVQLIKQAAEDISSRTYPDIIDPSEWVCDLNDVNFNVEGEEGMLDGLDTGMIPGAVLDSEPMNTNGFGIIGYYVKKWEIANAAGTIAPGDPQPRVPLVFCRKNDFEIIDERVRYGSTYRYQVHILGMSVFHNSATGQSARSILVSKDSRSLEIVCEERMPPQPPEWMGFHWFPEEYGNSGSIKMVWDEPTDFSTTGAWVNDIKQIQIFARKANNDPYSLQYNNNKPEEAAFELIGVCDYNDSAYLENRSITSLKSFESYGGDDWQMDINFTSHVKTDFNYDIDKDTDYIFTIAAVDARGISSSYGPQYRVCYKSEKNVLEVKFFSPKGAPKLYPNYLLENKAVMPVAKLSGYRRMKIYYCPDFTHLQYESSGTDSLDSVEALETPISDTSQPANYTVQFIDIGLQIDRKLDIKVVDTGSDEIDTTASQAYGMGNATNPQEAEQVQIEEDE